jgi:hypothetical protein
MPTSTAINRKYITKPVMPIPFSLKGAEPFREGINRKLFETTLHSIASDYSHFDMSLFRQVDSEDDRTCGTTCCFAGWAAAAACRSQKEFKAISYGNIEVFAGDNLGLTEDERRVLFYTHAWPSEFYVELTRYRRGTRRYTQVAIKRFMHFFKTGE